MHTQLRSTPMLIPMKSIQNGMGEGRASMMAGDANTLYLNAIFGRILDLMGELTHMVQSRFHTKNIRKKCGQRIQTINLSLCHMASHCHIYSLYRQYMYIYSSISNSCIQHSIICRSYYYIAPLTFLGITQ
jgi:alanyl-tRNA synthetase